MLSPRGSSSFVRLSDGIPDRRSTESRVCFKPEQCVASGAHHHRLTCRAWRGVTPNKLTAWIVERPRVHYRAAFASREWCILLSLKIGTHSLSVVRRETLPPSDASLAWQTPMENERDAFLDCCNHRPYIVKSHPLFGYCSVFKKGYVVASSRGFRKSAMVHPKECCLCRHACRLADALTASPFYIRPKMVLEIYNLSSRAYKPLFGGCRGTRRILSPLSGFGRPSWLLSLLAVRHRTRPCQPGRHPRRWLLALRRGPHLGRNSSNGA